jgi:hypothetical protein
MVQSIYTTVKKFKPASFFAVIPMVGTLGKGVTKGAIRLTKEATEAVRMLKVGDEAIKTAKALNILKSAPTKLLSSGEREIIMNTISDKNLRNTFDVLYRSGDNFPGGTAGAVIEEFRTGKLLSSSGHLIKTTQRISNLENILTIPNLSRGDAEIATILLDQLKNALNMVKK